jgi:hypothetical protein
MTNSLTTTLSTSRRALSVEVHRAVADLFEQLAAIFSKKKFTEMWGQVDPGAVREQWALGLSDMEPSEVDRGLAACRNRIFVPNIGEFRQLCRPVLDPEVAWHEASSSLREHLRGNPGEWSHPAVFRAAMAMNYELRTQSFSVVRRRWETVLNREFAAGWGDGVPAPVPRIENDLGVGVPMPPEIRERLNAVMRSLRKK